MRTRLVTRFSSTCRWMTASSFRIRKFDDSTIRVGKGQSQPCLCTKQSYYSPCQIFGSWISASSISIPSRRNSQPKDIQDNGSHVKVGRGSPHAHNKTFNCCSNQPWATHIGYRLRTWGPLGIVSQSRTFQRITEISMDTFLRFEAGLVGLAVGSYSIEAPCFFATDLYGRRWCPIAQYPLQLIYPNRYVGFTIKVVQ